MNSRDTTEATSSSLNSDTHKRLVHGSPDFVGAVAVDLLEELVEGCVSLQLLIFLLLADVHHHLVPLAGVVGRCGVLIWRRRRKGDRVKKDGLIYGLERCCCLKTLPFVTYGSCLYIFWEIFIECSLISSHSHHLITPTCINSTHFAPFATKSPDSDADRSHCNLISVVLDEICRL